jgi:hypothetical protein
MSTADYVDEIATGKVVPEGESRARRATGA